MHPAVFYFSCTYTNGISLRIIIKDYIITQTLIKNCCFNLVCNCKPKAANLKQFHSLILFDYCSVLKIRELTFLYRPILSTYMLYSNQLLVYQFNTLWDGHIFLSSEKYPSNVFSYKFTIDLFFGVCAKTEKTLKNWIIFLICKIIYH